MPRAALLTAAALALLLAWQWRRASVLERELASAKHEAALLRPAAAPPKPRQNPAASAAGPGSSDSPQKSTTTTDWEAALRSQDPLVRMTRFAGLLSTLTAASAPEVAALFQRLVDKEGDRYRAEQASFLRAWGRIDGHTAVESLATEGGGIEASPASQAALAGWAQTSPEAARDWLSAMKDEDARERLSVGLIDGWSLTDFDSAAAYATTLPRSTARDDFRELFIQRALDTGGPAAAQRWFSSIPADEHNKLYRERGFDELVSALSDHDLAATANWAASLGQQMFMAGAGLASIARRLGEKDSPEKAITWLDSFGTPQQGEAVQDALQARASLVAQWSQGDPNAAATWLREHEDHPAYDQMATSHSVTLARTDGPAAFAWADTIRDPEGRTEAREKIARTLLHTQGATARPTLNAAGFTDEQINDLPPKGDFSPRGDY